MEIIEQDRRFIKQARKDVESQAHKMLEQGMETQVRGLINADQYVNSQLINGVLYRKIALTLDCLDNAISLKTSYFLMCMHNGY